MRLRIVSHLVAGPRSEDEFPPIGKLGVQFTFQAEQDVTLLAPVIGKVAGAVFDQANPDIVELLIAAEDGSWIERRSGDDPVALGLELVRLSQR